MPWPKKKGRGGGPGANKPYKVVVDPSLPGNAFSWLKPAAKANQDDEGWTRVDRGRGGQRGQGGGRSGQGRGGQRGRGGGEGAKGQKRPRPTSTERTGYTPENKVKVNGKGSQDSKAPKGAENTKSNDEIGRAHV